MHKDISNVDFAEGRREGSAALQSTDAEYVVAVY
jgi:hypothetical protein